jgi:tetratricopeptide (TPR) repeat protein
LSQLTNLRTDGFVKSARTGAVLLAAVLYAAISLAQSDPEALYRERANVARAKEAAEIWQSRLTANPRDFESAWRFARATYWLGEQDVQDARRQWLERGVQAGRTAATLQPDRPEGHFWMAANMGALAESFGLRQGLKYRGPVKDALETVLRLDPAFLDGSADRALGRWYFRVPGLFGGSKKKSEEHLRKSLTYNPDNILSHYFLAETLFDMDRDADAMDELKKAIDAPFSRDFEPEDRVYKKQAMELLAKHQPRSRR